MRFTTLEEWLAWQESLHPHAIDLGLERVRSAADALGVGRFDVPVITIGGTNGKGSCVALLESILRAAGYRVGAFTSPHLIRYSERIHIDGREVADEAIVEAFARIDAARGSTSLTFFEFNTLAALLIFGAARLDAIVLEVGLGGRLDAVNVVDADVALLTSIGLDHCDWLGPTLEDIGREKAGIFRKGRPAVIGSLPVPETVLEAARQAGAELRLPGSDFFNSRRNGRWTWHNARARHADLPLPALAGRHQLDNAAAVLAVLDELRARLPVSRDAIIAGLERVSLKGRFQTVPVRAEWILDVAHNPDAAACLAETMGSLPRRARTIAVVGILKDKDARSIVAVLAPYVDQWIAVDLPGPRGLTGAELRSIAGAELDPRWSIAASVAAACERANTLSTQRDRVVVFGSFHTVGPALEWLEREP
jgi:dihydrofolate synthase / folylpolyglutamate synthase